MVPTYDLTGQVALVTGAGSGTGATTAKAFSGAGAAVLLVDHNEKVLGTVTRAIRETGGTALGFAADVSDEAHAKAAVARAVSEQGRLDMAYNNGASVMLGVALPVDGGFAR